MKQLCIFNLNAAASNDYEQSDFKQSKLGRARRTLQIMSRRKVRDEALGKRVRSFAGRRSNSRFGAPVHPRIFKCHLESCAKIFNDRASLKKHMTVHGDKLFQCTFEFCNKRFLDNAKLKRHMLVHTGEKPYQCEICLKKFSLDFNLKTHLRIHTGEKPFSCPYPSCNKRFN